MTPLIFALEFELLLDSVSECQIGLSSDHLCLSFCEEVETFYDFSVDSCVEYVCDIQYQGASIFQDAFAGW